MKYNLLNHQIALTLLKGVGVKNAKVILSYVGDIERVFDSSFDLRTKIPGFAKERFRELNREEALMVAKQIATFVEKKKIKTSFFTERNYPKRLTECNDSPILLYYKGDFDLNHKRTIAIVGTRNITSYGKQIINELIHTLKPYNVQIISGLALGVDGYVHKACLEHNIPTIGVLGHGLDRIYPHFHFQLAKKMLSTHGCGLMTEFPNGTKPDRENFPQRNRIVAGLSDATIVIESGEKGGSLITAHLANDYNREVFAYPGNVFNPFSKGCNRLIADNKAHLISNGEDFIRMMGWQKAQNEAVQSDLFEELDGDETTIVKVIKEFGKISLDILSIRLKRPVGKLSGILLGLEIKGVVMALPGKRYTLTKG